jgi:hypothetical protein
MDRRDTLGALLVLGAVMTSSASFSQEQRKMWRVGFLVPRRRPDSIDADLLGGFPLAMRAFGYLEGQNLVIEWRFGDGHAERLPTIAEELVRLSLSRARPRKHWVSLSPSRYCFARTRSSSDSAERRTPNPALNRTGRRPLVAPSDRRGPPVTLDTLGRTARGSSRIARLPTVQCGLHLA